MNNSNINTGVNSLLAAANYVRNETLINGDQAAQLDSLTAAVSDLTAHVDDYAAKIANRIANGLNVERLQKWMKSAKEKLTAAVDALRAWLVDFKANRPNVKINIEAPTTPETETTTNTEAAMTTTDNVTITISKDDNNLYTAKANGVPVGSVNGWFNNTFAACYAVGVKQRKALAMPELNHEDNAAHGFMSKANAVLWLGDMLVRYFKSNGISAKVINAASMRDKVKALMLSAGYVLANGSTLKDHTKDADLLLYLDGVAWVCLQNDTLSICNA